jgi:hypothetical protein
MFWHKKNGVLRDTKPTHSVSCKSVAKDFRSSTSRITRFLKRKNLQALTAYGQYNPVDIDMTDTSSTTVFSNGDEDGNEAIVEEVLYYANLRERKEQQAQFHHARAVQILEGLWARVQDEAYAYHTTRARGGMFKRINVLGGGVDDELIRRDQFPFG